MLKNKIKQVVEYVKVIANLPIDAEIYSFDFSVSAIPEVCYFTGDGIIYKKRFTMGGKFITNDPCRVIADRLGITCGNLTSIGYLDGNLVIAYLDSWDDTALS